MAKSGYIEITLNSQDITNNKSSIHVTGYITTSGDSWRGDQRGGTVTVYQGGTAIYNATFTHGAPANSTTALFSFNADVIHNSDGSSGAITANYNYDSGWCTGSGSYTLPTIPRVSEPTLNGSTFTITKAKSNYMRITTNRKSSGFTHHIYYSFNGSDEAIIASGVGDSYDWYFPDTLANSIPNSYQGTGYIRLYTFSGSTNIGSRTVSFKLQLASEFKPTASITLTDPTGYLGTYGKYVQGKSKIKVEITATGSYGSTVKTYSTSADGKTYTGTPVTTNVISSGSNITVNVTVTDSRGRTGTTSKTINVYAYEAPKISALSVKRCNSDGTNNSSGAYMAVIFTATITSLGSKNAKSYVLQYKKKSDSSYTSVTLSDYASSYSVTNGQYIFAADTASSYDIILKATDSFSSTNKSISGSAIAKMLSFLASHLGVAIGKIAELSNTFEVSWATILRSNLTVEGTAIFSKRQDLSGTAHNMPAMIIGGTASQTHIEIDDNEIHAKKGGTNPYDLHLNSDGGQVSVGSGGFKSNGAATFASTVNVTGKSTLSGGADIAGTVKLTGVDSSNAVSDFIVAKGTSGSWRYWKWSSGLAICIHNQVNNGNFGNTAWGSLYDGPYITFTDYPFTFSEIPFAFAARTQADSTTYNGLYSWIAMNGGSTTSPPKFDLVRATTATIGHPYLIMVAIGRWK